MTASRPDNEAIFHAARDIPDPDRRREYVREACGGDEIRIAHVEALLAAADGPDSLLDRPAAATPAATIDQPTAESPGTVIGPYKLLQQIGEGGMGIVYMAEQTEPVRRRVALKIIKPGMDSRQVIARFEAERQALAMMDHQNIARVLDAGTTDSGRPLLRHGAGPRRADHPVLRRPPPDAPRAAGAVRARLPGDPARAPEGDHPPRHQAVERPGDACTTTSRCPR